MRVLITGGRGGLARVITEGLRSEHEIVSPGRDLLDMLDVSALVGFLGEYGPFDVIIHTAVRGGRRTRPDTSDDFRDTVVMMENLLFAAPPDQKILHFDSGAYYGRHRSIYMCSEDDPPPPPPPDPYGLAKYCIFQRTLHDPRVRHLRIFNIFHHLEEEDRFIRTCLRSRMLGEPVVITGDRFFDFFSEQDFITVVRHFIENTQTPKVVNLSYPEKHRLSDVARMIGAPVQILDDNTPSNHYCGDGALLASLGLPLQGLQSGLDRLVAS